MEELFGDIFNWISSLSPIWAYVVIFAIAYGENVVPPIPGDMVIVFGGYLASTTEIDLFVVWGIATVGGALGFMTLYAFGYSMGDAVYSPDRYKWIPKNKMHIAKDWVLRWGYWVVIANRFLSGTRSVISLVVGITQMDAWKTATASTLSAFIWTGLITYAGYAIGENWEVMAEYLRLYGWAILSVTIGVGIVLFVIVMRRRKRRNN
ncbi:MAG: DedA family protein [Rhodothermaceae bacterium]|nr:DedA family protein [Rhodothermaceae bacterium]